MELFANKLFFKLKEVVWISLKINFQKDANVDV